MKKKNKTKTIKPLKIHDKERNNRMLTKPTIYLPRYLDKILTYYILST